MPSRFLMIDGYNLLHAIGLAREKYGPGELARKRLELLNRLSRRLTEEERLRCTVAFDAIEAPLNLPRRFVHQRIAVQFAEPGHTADELIELLVSQHSAPRRLTVVSSDHRLQTAIRRRRGLALDSEVFWQQLDSPDRHIGAPTAPQLPIESDTGELNFWMQEFTDVSASSLNQELQTQEQTPKNHWDQQIDQLQQRLESPDSLDEWLNEKTDRDRAR